MKIPNPLNNNYFPQSESNNGWRFLKDSNEIKNLTNMNLGKLDAIIEGYKLFFDTYASGIVVIKNGDHSLSNKNPLKKIVKELNEIVMNIV